MADDASPSTGASGSWRSTLLLWGPGLTVALGAGVVTSHGLYVVARASGVPAEVAWLYPLITDGLALVAYTATHRLPGNRSRYAWTVVIVAAGLSGLAQAVYLADGASVASSPALRLGVGAWPAVAAATAAHLLDSLKHPATTEVDGPSQEGAAISAGHLRSVAQADEPSAAGDGDGEGVVLVPPPEGLPRGRGGLGSLGTGTTRSSQLSRSTSQPTSGVPPRRRPP